MSLDCFWVCLNMKTPKNNGLWQETVLVHWATFPGGQTYKNETPTEVKLVVVKAVINPC